MTDKTDEQVVASEIKCPVCGSEDNRLGNVCSPKFDKRYHQCGSCDAFWLESRRADGGEREKAARLVEAAGNVVLYAQEDGHGYRCRTEDIEKLYRAVEEWEK